jgi:hypothetical protein
MYLAELPVKGFTCPYMSQNIITNHLGFGQEHAGLLSWVLCCGYCSFIITVKGPIRVTLLDMRIQNGGVGGERTMGRMRAIV